MKDILYDICKDAIVKAAGASGEERELLARAAAHALMLSYKARREGLLALEKAAAVQPVSPDYVRQLVELIVDGRDPQIVLEAAANSYWVQNPQGIHAMVRYFYIRALLLMQMGEDPHITESLFVSLIPDSRKNGFLEQVTAEKERLELEEQKGIAEAFSKLRPSFQSALLLEKRDALEAKVCSVHDATLQRILKETDMRTLAVCLYAFREEARERILQRCEQKRMGDILMQETVWRGTLKEEMVLAVIEKMDSAARQLRERGETAE